MDGRPKTKTKGRASPTPSETVTKVPPAKKSIGQIVLVLQGGGALGAYHAGVYNALHEAGREPGGVIGTSIGAINGALIAGNPRDSRLQRIQQFWDLVGQRAPIDGSWLPTAFLDALTKMATVTQGVGGFYRPNLAVALGVQSPVGIDHASFYSTEPL